MSPQPRISAAATIAVGWACLALCVVEASAAAESSSFTVGVKNVSVQLGSDGQIQGAALGEKSLLRAVSAETVLRGCRREGEVAVRQLDGGGVEFQKHWIHDATKNRCVLVERFVPAGQSVRWEVEICGAGAPWSTPIETHLRWPNAAEVKYWTAWSDCRPKDAKGWVDPLQAMPLADRTLYYGARTMTDADAFGIPMVSILDAAADLGLTIALSPEDLALDMRLAVTRQGQFVFSRMNHRIGAASPIRFALDLVAHPADWRAGLGWMVSRYPAYFDPPNPSVQEMAGCGAYSSHAAITDPARLRAMAFTVNWKASFDFPFMGMFLPPVGSDSEEWTDFKGQKTSIARMRGYAQEMRRMGFYVLSYFNVTECGAHYRYPPPPRRAASDADLWKNANDFLFYQVGDAILRGGDGKPIGSWEGCVAMDPGEPVYQKFLLDQARRHIEKLPETSGICIDRLDWLRYYNRQRDDHVTWFQGKPARSLSVSWRDIMSKLGPLMHDAGKVIYVNPMYGHLGLMRHVDGMYDEHGQWPASLNRCALLGLHKPLMAWTWNVEELRSDPDAYFQRHLHMGAYLTAPVPGNDHTILPAAGFDQYYLDYGPLLEAMRGKRWVLLPHVIEVLGNAAKANLFQVSGGYAIPVTFAGKAATVGLALRGLEDVTEKTVCEVIHPGGKKWIPVKAAVADDEVHLDVPVQRGCAMVRLQTR